MRYGKLVWKTKVGVHNGHDEDGTLALRHLLPKLKFPLVVEPGIVGGVETTMAVADGVVYVPVANLASEWKTRNTGADDECTCSRLPPPRDPACAPALGGVHSPLTSLSPGRQE